MQRQDTYVFFVEQVAAAICLHLFNTDWSRYEVAEGTHCVEPCGPACDSWNRYEEDLDLIVELGLNSFRLSVEWARIEPEQGVIDHEALAHYRAVLEACHARSILPVVTLHHFTLPLWVADQGGFENSDIAAWMGAYPRSSGNRSAVSSVLRAPSMSQTSSR